jgi:UDP-glucose:(heptosyl)LPS alpha-1,3-glucosyltransferase
LAERVYPLGELKDPLPVYQAADAMLLPSQREGFSLATAEAMSVGLPVCRTRTAGAAELIVEDVTGRTTPIDREAWVRTAIDFLRDEEGLRRMSANAPAHVRGQFTFDRQLRETIALYRKLAGFEVGQSAPEPMPAPAPPTPPSPAPAGAS